MTSYEFFLTIHILAAMVWFGAGVFLNVLMGKLSASGDFQTIGKLSGLGKFYSRAIFDPAAIVTLLAGVAMVLVQDGLEFSDPFISIGFAGVLITLGLGHGVISPTSEKLQAAFAEGRAEDAQALGKKMGMVSMIDTLVLVLVIIAMVVKPF